MGNQCCAHETIVPDYTQPVLLDRVTPEPDIEEIEVQNQDGQNQQYNFTLEVEKPTEVQQQLEDIAQSKDINLPDNAVNILEMPPIKNPLVKNVYEKLDPIELKYLSNYKTYHAVKIEILNDEQQLETLYYQGQWNLKQREGAGVQLFPQDTYYEGQWSNNQFNGYGRCIYDDGSYYVGNWKNGEFHGQGKLVNKELTYEGDWIQNKQHGYGVEHKVDGTTYEGEYAQSKKHGAGNLTFADKSYYRGEFHDGKYKGCGEYRWPDGRVYNGEWFNNKMFGHGVFSYPNGDKYEGSYANDHRDGMGEFKWKDGRSVKGIWKNGKLDGEAQINMGNESGVFSYRNGQRIEQQ